VAIKVKIPKSRATGWRRFFAHPVGKAALAVLLLLFVGIFTVFAFYYVRYERLIDTRMRGRIFNNAAKIYARPREVAVGDKGSPQEIALQLKRAGYTEEGSGGQSPLGAYKIHGTDIVVTPGPESYHASETTKIHFVNGQIEHISGKDTAGDIDSYELEPQLVTALFEGEKRTKRRLVKYDDIPKVLVDAVTSIEDRRFFEHSGVNYYRLIEAAYTDIRTGKREEGASTITMQLARGFFLTPEKTIRRKVTEMLIAIQLEQRFSKPQIFELYANSVDMGQRGSYAIKGLGEASQSYFGKDIKNLTLPEAALLAGLIQRPSYLSPYRHPDRALERRNLVLDSMVDTGAITRAEAEKAKATPLKLAPPNVEASDAPYFVDLVKDTLQQQYSESELNEHGDRIYTTLDPDLQRIAAECVAEGMKSVDKQVNALRSKRVRVGKGKNAKWETTIAPGPEAQVAMVVIDPHTGQVLALVGGRNYGMSQVNHAVAFRPTGSAFKPFVYAAALNTALDGSNPVLTPATIVDDSPTTFTYGDQIYEPRNYKDEYHGQVPLRFALAHSLNNATVKVAEMVGYDKVAKLAQAAGIKDAKPTPAMAIGAYSATPLDVAGAYTVFANSGTHIDPQMVLSLRDAKGEVIQDYKPETHPVLDPRVAFVVTNMMQGVLDYGTAAGVRAQTGFTAPAAGKTGTSHDAWFAGYTSNLLAVVWIGFDNYADLRLSGATTAAPIWGNFMKKATALPAYHDTKPFYPPAGVVDVRLDKITNRLATSACPEDYDAAFIAGTQPAETCEQTAGDQRNLFQKIFGIGAKPPSPPPVSNTTQQTSQAQPAQPAQPAQDNKNKKGFFGRIFGVFGGGKSDKNQTTTPAPPPSPR
jgi:penicillin-binding protein 1B